MYYIVYRKDSQRSEISELDVRQTINNMNMKIVKQHTEEHTLCCRTLALTFGVLLTDV